MVKEIQQPDLEAPLGVTINPRCLRSSTRDRNIVSTLTDSDGFCSNRTSQGQNASSTTTTSTTFTPCQLRHLDFSSSPLAPLPSSGFTSPRSPRSSLIVRLKISNRNITLMQNPIGQNSDGSWFCGPHTLPKSLKKISKGVFEELVIEESNQVSKDTSEAIPRKRRKQARPINYNEDIDSDSVLGMTQECSNFNACLRQELISQKRKRELQEEEFVVGREQLAPPKTRYKKLRIKELVEHEKPKPFGEPFVWADKRQQLCEALPYYRAYQSGAYMHDGIVKGFLCDKEVGFRDKFTDEVMICRVGGGRAPDGNGTMVQARDQNVSSVALALQRTMDLCLPVAIIVGRRNPLCQILLPHYYCVLDWFHVTDVWCEIMNRFKVWMVRFEKIDLSKRSWWSPSSDFLSPTQVRDFDNIKTYASCRICRHASKLIYNIGWTCQNNQCIRFFDFAKEYDPVKLGYRAEFLNERTKFLGEDPGSLTPSLLTDADLASMEAFGIEKECRRGIVCPLCGCCSRRIKWDHWFCENPSCNFTHRVRQLPIPISEVVRRCLDSEEIQLKDTIKEGVRVGQSIKGLYDVYEYIVPGLDGEDIGFVRHFKANGIINQQPDGPNDLFMAMQQDNFDLKRNPARLPGLPGEILTSHWAVNWGAPYKYGVSVLSRGFNEAPTVIIKALKRLTWAGEQAVTENFDSFHPFNELLSIGYFEGTAIGYHDDGESELGPTVATLSLGAAATMSFRPKARNSLGLNSGRRNAAGTKPDALKITLEHGDLVVMHGRDIQKLYEHAVTPHGKLRFALTCRYIRPELLSETDKEIAAVKSTIPPEWDHYVYDGDVNAKATVPIVQRDEAETIINKLRAKIMVGEVDATHLEALRQLLPNA
ncbi:hypothetical protein B7463_g9945, partial [Scytalidium lignicola]